MLSFFTLAPDLSFGDRSHIREYLVFYFTLFIYLF